MELKALKNKLNSYMGEELDLTVNENYTSKIENKRYKKYHGTLKYISANMIGVEIKIGIGKAIKSFTFNDILIDRVKIDTFEEEQEG